MPYIGSLWQTLAIPWFSLQVAYIGTDIFQMLVALIFSPVLQTSWHGNDSLLAT